MDNATTQPAWASRTNQLIIVGLVLGVAALVCGLLSRRDAPLPAGIGIGVGVALIASALTGLLYALTSYL